jgi:hypothetical protein
MPRFVRPSFVKIHVDGLAKEIATGPRSRSGELSAEFLVRSKGFVLPLLDVDMIASADGASVLVRVTLKHATQSAGPGQPETDCLTNIVLYERRFEQ